MLTKLRLKNWRSVKEAEIDLAPITVFIGANSSGKTNILDALYFLRESSEDGILQAVQNRGGAEKVRSLGADPIGPVEIEFSFKADALGDELTYLLGLKFNEPITIIPEVSEYLESGNKPLLEMKHGGLVQFLEPGDDGLKLMRNPPLAFEQTSLSVLGRDPTRRAMYQTFQFMTERWQMLDENFMPPLSLVAGTRGSIRIIDRCADNVPILLDIMQKYRPELYEEFQNDLKWLLGHVDSVITESNDRETRFALHEKQHNQQEAPTISSGSARLVAILTAVYALNLTSLADMPGLVVIEEPDTALNPGILRNFVEQLRVYTEGDAPRQFILTTHNPRFLDYFKPEEVRVVSRDENGYTTVSDIPKHIPEVWLEDGYTLGEVWMTHSLGGLPE